MGDNSYHQAPDAVATAPSGCPVHQTWSPLNADYLDDPYPIAKQLAEDHSLFWSEPLGHVVVTHPDDICLLYTSDAADE